MGSHAIPCINLGSGSVLVTVVPREQCSIGKPSIVFSKPSKDLKVGQSFSQELTQSSMIAVISVASIESLDVLAYAIEVLRKHVKNYELTVDKKQQNFLGVLTDDKEV